MSSSGMADVSELRLVIRVDSSARDHLRLGLRTRSECNEGHTGHGQLLPLRNFSRKSTAGAHAALEGFVIVVPWGHRE